MRHISTHAMQEELESVPTLLERAVGRNRSENVLDWYSKYFSGESYIFLAHWILHSTVLVFESISCSVIFSWLLVSDRIPCTSIFSHSNITYSLFLISYKTNFLYPFIYACLTVSPSKGSWVVEWHYPLSFRLVTSWVDDIISEINV